MYNYEKTTKNIVHNNGVPWWQCRIVYGSIESGIIIINSWASATLSVFRLAHLCEHRRNAQAGARGAQP